MAAAIKRPAKAPACRADYSATKLFADKVEWAAWLGRNHSDSPGLWLQIAKKGSNSRSVTYKDALDIALCYGWIDGQKRPENDQSWLQRFLPRSARSLWSRINRDKALALIASGEMKPAGLKAIEAGKRAGRWATAYDSPRRAAVPSDFQAALEASHHAKSFFETLDKANRYAILWRIQTLKKADTRARKITHFIEMLERRQKIHG